MKKRKQIKPTEGELEILKILWDHGPSTVRFVHEILNAQKKIGYTTTLKTMQIMFEKKILSRNEENRSHLYMPEIKKQETQKLLIKNLVDKVFGGSASNLILQALGGYKASQEEVSEIREVLNKIEGVKK